MKDNEVWAVVFVSVCLSFLSIIKLMLNEITDIVILLLDCVNRLRTKKKELV